MAALPAAGTVAQLLREPTTRSAALEFLESHVTPIEHSVALAAAPMLCELLVTDVEQFDRVALLLARLCVEAPDDPAPLYGAAWGGGRLEALWRSDSNAVSRALRKPVRELTPEDVRSMICVEAVDQYAYVRGCTKAWAAAGLPGVEFLTLMMRAHPVASLASDSDFPQRILELALEQLRSGELPSLSAAGAWNLMSLVMTLCINGLLAVQGQSIPLEMDICGTALDRLRVIGTAGDWVVSVSVVCGCWFVLGYDME
jgi:hypothetical protein